MLNGFLAAGPVASKHVSRLEIEDLMHSFSTKPIFEISMLKLKAFSY